MNIAWVMSIPFGVLETRISPFARRSGVDLALVSSGERVWGDDMLEEAHACLTND